MTTLFKKIISEFKPNFWTLTFPLLAIFLPIFIVHFGAHTDGFYLITKKWAWLGDPEGATMFMQGRPISAYLNSIIGWFITDVSQLTLLRIFVFIIKLYTGFLIYNISRQLNLAYRWTALIVCCFLLLPSNIINVIWVANGVPESISLLCGTASYYYLSKYIDNKSIKYLIPSSILFMIALLMYQPMATITFGLIFLRLFFSETPSFRFTKIKVIKEILLYSCLLGLYWLLIKFFILPFGKNTLGLAASTNSMYQMDLVKNLWAKYTLISDLAKRSLIGTWDFLLYKNNTLEWTIIATSFSIASVTIILNKIKESLSFSNSLQKIFLACTLFILSNAPSLMAANYVDIIGYRTFTASSLMGLCLIIGYYKYCYHSLKPNWLRIANLTFISAYFLSVIFVASWTINQSIRNYLREYSYIDKIASNINYQDIDKVILILNRPQDTVIEYDLPGELGLMTTSSSHVQYIFNKYSSRINKTLTLNETFKDWPIYSDDHTQVIDLTTLRNGRDTYTKLGKKVEIQIISSKEQKIYVQDISGGSEYPIFMFFEKGSTPNSDSYWQVKPGNAQGTIVFHFINEPEKLINYKLAALCVNSYGKATNFHWDIEASLDNKEWTNIASTQWDNTDGNSNRSAPGRVTTHRVEP